MDKFILRENKPKNETIEHDRKIRCKLPGNYLKYLIFLSNSNQTGCFAKTAINNTLQIYTHLKKEKVHKITTNTIKLRDSGISLDENREVSIHGTPLRGSNIVDLVNDLIRAKRHSKPLGWRDFLTALQIINVPKEFICRTSLFYTAQKSSVSISFGNSHLHPLSLYFYLEISEFKTNYMEMVMNKVSGKLEEERMNAMMSAYDLMLALTYREVGRKITLAENLTEVAFAMKACKSLVGMEAVIHSNQKRFAFKKQNIKKILRYTKYKMTPT
uniref:(California timema) hypothetical protein n=1 Tax=Timema californicum TaxID=61474 RepID=A0A7R9IWI3_TIMCA|nr:unnamed protein product [Timema californicum]